MRELSLQEIQKVELDILKVVANICEKENIRYFLHYGTLIGAIRHEGFIPWDDDLDVVMPRPDYERFLSYCRNHANEIQPLELMHYTTNKSYIFPIARVSDSRFYVNYEGKKDYGLGVFVDIYPFDGCGNTKEEAKEICKRNSNDISIISSGGRNYFEKSPGGLKRNIVKFLLYCYTNVFGLKQIIKHLDTESRKHIFEKDNLSYCTIWGTSSQWSQNRSDFESYIYAKFEDAEFRIFKNYDEVLRIIYGDYMKLPPEEKRIGHHYYKAYIKELQKFGGEK
ncbi:lipopolysaccharide cholinephosphotransferase [Anaerotaenia torta]|uniref:LicD family protein n=1 Tax=Anaerotaenia torta TaxID=433293 RepID=UPI003D1A0D30